MAPKVVLRGTFTTDHDAVTSLKIAYAAFAGRRVKITSQPDAVIATGGRRIVYRLIGSRSPRYGELMPWRADLRITASTPSESAVSLTIASDQGWYLYQGQPTRKKWEHVLASIQANVVAALDAQPT